MRIIDIINRSLSNDILIAEEEIERIINVSDMETETKISLVKEKLNQIVLTQLSQGKLIEFTTKITIDNEIQKNNE